MKKTKGRLISSAILTLALVMIIVMTASACDTNEGGSGHTHTLQQVAAVAPTCTKAGNTAYWLCTADDCTSTTKKFSDAKGESEIADSSSVILAAKGHTIAKVDATAATCTEAGTKEHWKCSDCGSLFADASGSTATTETELTVPATGHTPAATWTSNNTHHWKGCTAQHGAVELEKAYHDLDMTLSGGKREFLKYETLDVTGLTASLDCEICGYEKSIDVSNAMVSGYDKSTSGTQTLTVKQGSGETETTATYDVTVSETAMSFTLTLDNAWFDDDASEKEMSYGSALPETVKLVNGKNHIGWYDRVNSEYYNGGDDFTLTSDVKLTAVYSEDISEAFTPSCVFEAMAGGAQTTMTHTTVGQIKATTFALDGGVAAGTGYKILNGAGTRPDSCTNRFPVYGDAGSLMMMTFVNNGTEELEIKYQAEYWGIRGEVIVTIPASGEVTAALSCTMAAGRASTASAFNQIYFNKAVSGNISLTIYGKAYTYTDYSAQLNAHILTLNGATFADGTTEGYFGFEADALSGAIVSDTKTFVGWADQNNTYYTKDAFLMPATDTTLYAVYKEDMLSFTPSCAFEAIVGGAKSTMAHTTVGDFKATTFALEGGIAAGTGYKILNGDSSRPDKCENFFPIYGNKDSFALMTFVNNGTEELTIKYQAEYWGVRGEVIVTIPAGGTVDGTLACTKAEGKNPTTKAFSQIYFNNAVSGDISLTIYGRIYDPDAYEKMKPRQVTFEGATYDGESSATMMSGDKLTKEIVTDESKTLVAWATSNGVFATTEDLIADFTVGIGDATITALYEDTIGQYMVDKTLFTPSCVYKDKSKADSEKKQGVHNADGSTTYVIDTSVASWMIYNGSDEKNKNDGNSNNGCPVSTNTKRLYYYTFTNGGDADLTIQLGPEYYGLKTPATVTIPAGGTVSMGMLVYGFDKADVFWQINNLATAEGEASLTMVCRYV